MTLRSYGRVTPSRMEMLCLAGGVLQGFDITVDASDDDRIRSMRDARSTLCQLTGADFGYDLHQWHDFLSAARSDPYGYRHPYAWYTVKRAILRFIIDDSQRQRLVALIRKRYPPAAGHEWEDPLLLLPPMIAHHLFCRSLSRVCC